MSTLESILRRINHDLTSERRAFALVGGLAVSVRTEPRFTRDTDLVVAVQDDAEAEAVARGLKRPQDLVDLRALIRVATEADDAHRLVGLIVARGYHRGRDLARELIAIVKR
ncbi:MAG: hypothetical protein ACRD2A_06320 [Vicinamibacterales bacterium]